MSRLNVRLERLEKDVNIHRRATPLFDPAISERMKQDWMKSPSCQNYLQAIRMNLRLPDSMTDMEVILNHSKEITAYLIEQVDGKTKDLVRDDKWP